LANIDDIKLVNGSAGILCGLWHQVEHLPLRKMQERGQSSFTREYMSSLASMNKGEQLEFILVGRGAFELTNLYLPQPAETLRYPMVEKRIRVS